MKGKIFLFCLFALTFSAIAPPELTEVLDMTPAAGNCGKWCVRCSPDNKQCLECVGSNLIDGRCVESLNCVASQFILTHPVCTACAEPTQALWANRTGCEISTQSIPNCAVYSKTNICSSCISGFYVESTSAGESYCAPRDPAYMPGCTKFSGSANTCTECNTESHYLSSGKCVARSLLYISHCTSFNPLTDDCIKCDSPNLYYLTGSPTKCEKRSILNDCALFSDTLDRCSSCDNGYYLSSGGICFKVSRMLHCVESKTTSDACNKCEDGYYPSSGTCIKQNKIPYCVKYSTTALGCESCSLDRYLSSGVCKLRTPDFDCSEFEVKKDSCKVCKTGYYLGKNGRCSLRILSSTDKCTTSDPNADVCLVCKNTGYYLDNGICTPVTVVDNCGTYHPTANRCAACSPPEDYYLVTAIDTSASGTSTTTELYTCRARTINPKGSCSYDSYLIANADECTTCTRAQYYQSGNNCIKRQILFDYNCGTYVIDGEGCSSCESTNNYEKYYLSGAKCISRILIDNCSEYNPNANTCSKCTNNYYVDGSGARCTIRDKSSSAENCDTTSNTDDSDVCSRCTDSYYLTGTPAACQFRSSIYTGCTTKSPTSNACKICSDTYYLAPSAVSCTAGTIANCVKYSATANTCEKCAANMYLASNTECKYRTTSDACSKWDTTVGVDRCTDCTSYTTHYLANGDCKARVVTKTAASCTRDTYADRCTACTDNYYLSEFGTCEFQSKDIEYCMQYSNTVKDYCDQCYTEVDDTTKAHYNRGDGLCVARTKVENCLRFDPDSDNCIECTSSSYYLLAGQCRKTEILGCNKQSNQFDCLECDNNNFYQSGTACVRRKTDPNCEKFSVSGDLCETCRSGFGLHTSGVCFEQIIPEGCRVLNKNSLSTCKSCLQGYWMYDEVCYKAIEIDGCEEYVSERRCGTCIYSKAVSQDGTQCLPIKESRKVAFCLYHQLNLDAEETHHTCLECITGFTEMTVNRRSTCVPEITPDGCEDKTCQKCKSPDYYSIGFSPIANMQICIKGSESVAAAAPPQAVAIEDNDVTPSPIAPAIMDNLSTSSTQLSLVSALLFLSPLILKL